MVPPRGCAYVVMEHRKEASRGLVVLKNTRMYNNTLKVCSNFCCYIFWSSLSLRMCVVSHWSIFSMHVSDQYLNMPVTCFTLVCPAHLSDQIEGGQEQRGLRMWYAYAIKGAVLRQSSSFCLILPITCPQLLWNLK